MGRFRCHKPGYIVLHLRGNDGFMLLFTGKEPHAYLRSRQEVLMKAFIKSVSAQLLALLLSVSVAFAQTVPPAPRNAAATQQELDQMLAPIALYPDSLLSQIFMASSYPLEGGEAARWSRANPGLKGQEAVAAVEPKDWDPSVKSLAAFPQVLAMMDQQLEWTARLGDVFIAQEPQVMETVQSLRQKAYAAGNLRSTEQAYVVQQGDAFAWGGGIRVGSGFFFSSCDWRARHVTIVNVTNVFVNRSGVVNRPAPVRTGQPVVWQHDPGHRRGVPYHIASLQQRFGASTQAGQRRDFRWQDPVVPASRNGSLNRPEVHSDHLRPNPRRDDGRAGRADGRGNFSPNPAVVRSEVRPEPGVSRPPVAAPQVHAGPGSVPRVQNPAPQPAPHNPQAQGFAGRGQAGNRPVLSAPRAHGE